VYQTDDKHKGRNTWRCYACSRKRTQLLKPIQQGEDSELSNWGKLFKVIATKIRIPLEPHMLSRMHTLQNLKHPEVEEELAELLKSPLCSEEPYQIVCDLNEHWQHLLSDDELQESDVTEPSTTNDLSNGSTDNSFLEQQDTGPNKSCLSTKHPEQCPAHEPNFQLLISQPPKDATVVILQMNHNHCYPRELTVHNAKHLQLVHISVVYLQTASMKHRCATYVD